MSLRMSEDRFPQRRSALRPRSPTETDRPLPAGFTFPGAYLEMLSQPEPPDLEPWWFLEEDKSLGYFWTETLEKLYPGRSLIPFAKRDGSDDLACFDGSNATGNPKVFHVHAYAPPGGELRGEAETFADWLTETRAESEKFKAGIE